MQIEDHLTRIRNSMATGQRKEPARLLKDLIDQMGSSELSDWRPDILRIVDEFTKKPRRELLAILDRQIQGHSDSGQSKAGIASPSESPSISPTSALVTDFRHALDDLRERHIFQWKTFYRDCLDSHFDRFLDAMFRPSPDDSVEALADPLSDHTYSIFSQGYDYVIRNHTHADAITKSLNGLSQFLAVPLDYYSARASSVSGYRSTVALRLLFSATLSGILEGYSRVSFDHSKGSSLLARFQRQWVHYAAYLTPRHAERVIASIEPSSLTNGLTLSALPLLDALQRFFRRENDDYWPMPVLGQYTWNERRLDIGIHTPRNAVSQRLVETRSFLEEGFVTSGDLDNALGRQVALIIAPLRPDMRKFVSDRERLKEIVVPAEQPFAETKEATGRSRTLTAERAFSVLDDALYALRSKLEAKSPITYNFASEFPLKFQDRASAFHVVRTSVRDLLRTFERRNGVRLWCSIRRSGKTTACFDMETTTGDSVIVGQTCGVSPDPVAAMFYDRVRTAVGSGRMVSSTFVKDLITECAPVDITGKRIVLIVDEYETLFGLLRNAARGDTGIRYNVVQPILDQLTTFAQDNLLVFLGQQPDAYFILMDQNQLAPYVTQDSFPLFEHVSKTATGEFSNLVDKILSKRIECTAGFLDALYNETAGHPFLTANVLVEFVDWLIESERPQNDLRVRETDFAKFSRGKLNTNRIMLSPQYDFFRQAAAAALSEQGYRDNPWLFGVYWVLRELSSRGSSTFSVRRTNFEEVTSRIPVPKGGCPPDCSVLLRTASQANFLSHDNRYVRVRIRTLGRIAASVRPALA